MKILIDVRVLMDSQYSGVPEYVYNLLQALFELDRANEYLLFYNNSRPVTMPTFNYPNVRYVARRIPRKIPNKILNYLLFKILKRPRLENLIVESFDLLLMPHINFIAFRSGTNSILTIHDLSFARYSEFFRLNNNIWHWAVNVKGLVNKFSQVIAVSEHTKRDIVQLTGVSADKVKVIYSGVGSDYRPLAQADSELMRVRQKYHLPEKFILFLGTIEPRKNIISLIKAYEQLRQDNNYADVALIIAGAIGGASAKILRYARNSKFSASIKFIGYVDSLDKNPLYNLATVFAFPSFYEGFGFPPLEAMASGTPVVAGWGTSLAEIVGTAGILINPDDSQDLANGLNLVLSDANLAQSLRDRGLAQASRFSWTKCALGYLELINNANIK